MEQDAQHAPRANERRLSYCEITAKDPGNPRLGAGHPEEMLGLPDDGTNIRFFMLDPVDACPWRARWCTGDLDEKTGRITTNPWHHPSQAKGAWGGFFIPLVAMTSRIAQRILALGHHRDVSQTRPVWVRVQPRGLAVARSPGRPTLSSLLDDRQELRWWPVYVRLFGDVADLGLLLKLLIREYADVDTRDAEHD